MIEKKGKTEKLLVQYGLQLVADYGFFDLKGFSKGSVEVGAGEARIDRTEELSDFAFALERMPLLEYAQSNAPHRYILRIDQGTPHRERIPLQIKIKNSAARIRIVVEEGIQATIEEVIRIEGQGVALIEIELKENAQLRYIAINQTSLNADSSVGRLAKLSSHAQIHWFDGQMGGNRAQSAIISELSGDHCQATLRGIVFAHDHQRPDIMHSMIHLGKEGNSQMLVKSVAAEFASVMYRGLIHLQPQSRHSVATQREDALLLSSQASVAAIPELKIEHNEVKCSHGVSNGRLRQDTLFYLLSRGFSEEEARKALVMAHVMPALQGIEDHELRGKVQAIIEEYIEQHL